MPRAHIVGAIIGAVGAIIAATIPVVAAVLLGVVQINIPAIVAPTKVSNDIPVAQATYTRLPTYTPYPTFTPARTIIAPRPITVIPTASADQQDPAPGSVIPAGQGFKKNGIIESRPSNGTRPC